ncbi:4Fe-4S dicluster domain-containing protein [Photobacterium atrarenae]|uniref:4Fe-4S dicluster domain-containing protein n=1 Tax=Photobacterium atrarenae TaxID=865757 RepID=A0ABY5GMN2_9GAMM|nr:4Fe-4S dicluster domain-containing protein [Photobacterium atrarenae]UTV30512.1 4Fe-4S dicluster domain-containing protein [Photobacterium atrarenae]
MQQYLVESLKALQDHLSRARQFYQVVEAAPGDAHWQHIIPPAYPPLSAQKPQSSAKSFFFAEQEPLYVFDGQFFRETLPSPEPFVLFGVQSCDLTAIHYQDLFFEQDVYYQARRRQALLVGIDCVHPCAQGFCYLVNAGPGVRDETADLILHPLEDNQWLLVVVTAQGKEAIQGVALTPASAQEMNQRWEQLSHCEQEFDDHSYITEGVERLNRGEVSDALWQRIGVQCLACSGCTTLCPTCSCYGTQSQPFVSGDGEPVAKAVEVSGTLIKEDSGAAPNTEQPATQQVRFWDSCLYEGFQREASFNNPSAQAGERVKRFWYHKFSDDFLPEFGRYGCVGCGRCEQVCPGVIGVHSVMKRIVDDA